MTHGDDDGLRVPPRIAPHQIVILPMLRDKPEDERLLAYCEEICATALAAQNRASANLSRVLLDSEPGKAAQKRWDWVRKGAPIIVEVGPPRHGERTGLDTAPRPAVDARMASPTCNGNRATTSSSTPPGLLEEIQQSLFNEARTRRDANITRRHHRLDGVAEYFGEGAENPGWVAQSWSQPDRRGAGCGGGEAQGAEADRPQRAERRRQA